MATHGKAAARKRKGKERNKQTMDPIKLVLEKGLAPTPKGGMLGPVQMSVLAKYILAMNAKVQELEQQQQQGDSDE